VVDGESDLVAVEIDFQHLVNRFADKGQLLDRTAEQQLLHRAANVRDDDHQAGMKSLGRIKAAKISGVVLMSNEITVARMTRYAPVSPAASPM
jgi:phage terminase large subunit-like protein